MASNKRPRLDDDAAAAPPRVAPVQVYIPMRKLEGKWEPIDAAYVYEADASKCIRDAKAEDGEDSGFGSDSDESGYEEAAMWGHSDDYDEGNPDHRPRYKLWVLSVEY